MDQTQIKKAKNEVYLPPGFSLRVMENNKLITFIKEVVKNSPEDWLNLTTHRLDIYEEERAKEQFLEQFELLFSSGDASLESLSELPTAYDYIRLGHPLSCVLEWTLAIRLGLDADHVISFSSNTIPAMAVLRKNLLAQQNTQILYTGDLPKNFDAAILKSVYGYHFDLKQIESTSEIPKFEGSIVLLTESPDLGDLDIPNGVDFYINIIPGLGSIIMAQQTVDKSYISEIQHVRRRETIAMTPANSLLALNRLIGENATPANGDSALNKKHVIDTIREVTGTGSNACVASSGLSMQYAIAMGLIHEAQIQHPGKAIRFVVPPNCYGGTNDQARRVAACLENVTVMDLPVDSGSNMVSSVEIVLDQIAVEDAVPYIIAEIPTNPRVEVPDLVKLRDVLSKQRKTNSGSNAVAPVFILDQTFCPNTPFLGEGEILSSVKAISYVSGSKFPSGGKCTAGYCVANKVAESLMDRVAFHLGLCDNEATELQYEILAAQLPSMISRIQKAYSNTREFVTFIEKTLPDAKINFVSEELAAEAFTPSVFSLDLPTKGNSDEERESYKRELNLRLINMMIEAIPGESKYCVSYGQLKGCYWTIPATSTQGTTKEGDKDYIARVAVSPDLDLDLHKKVFADFVATL